MDIVLRFDSANRECVRRIQEWIRLTRFSRRFNCLCLVPTISDQRTVLAVLVLYILLQHFIVGDHGVGETHRHRL
ncbi:hypothetical protein D3C76_1858490 [compost metagenome]